MRNDVLIQKIRALFSALDIKARISHVNMRATFTLNNNWEGNILGDEEGVSVFNSRAINEWTFNG